MGEFRNVKQVGDQLAHHLTGIILIVIRKRKLFIMIEQLLAHIPFHVGSHHVALIADVIFTQALGGVHDQKKEGDGGQRF